MGQSSDHKHSNAQGSRIGGFRMTSVITSASSQFVFHQPGDGTTSTLAGLLIGGNGFHVADQGQFSATDDMLNLSYISCYQI